MTNYAANAFTNAESYQDLNNLCGMFESIFLKQAAGIPGYTNTEIGNYLLFITGSVANGGQGGTSGRVGNSSVKSWFANAAMINLCNTFYIQAANS